MAPTGHTNRARGFFDSACAGLARMPQPMRLQPPWVGRLDDDGWVSEAEWRAEREVARCAAGPTGLAAHCHGHHPRRGDLASARGGEPSRHRTGPLTTHPWCTACLIHAVVAT